MHEGKDAIRGIVLLGFGFQENAPVILEQIIDEDALTITAAMNDFERGQQHCGLVEFWTMASGVDVKVSYAPDNCLT
ncbi:MAG: hypothetical protein AB7S38_11525 [Vulcanimicrobiota bacterium]